jgi:hypothetical protein
VTPTAADLGHARFLWDYLRLGVAIRTADLYEQEMAPLIVVSAGTAQADI